MNIYKYGMRCRPYSIGAQPMNNLIEAQEDATGQFYNILVYSAPLDRKDIEHYSLTDLQAKKSLKEILIVTYKPLNKIFLRSLQEHTKTESENKYNLITLINAYCEKHTSETDPDFITYLIGLQENECISSQLDYLEIIDYMLSEVMEG